MIKKLLSVGVPIAALIGLFVLMYVASQGVSMPVIDTRGQIGNQQRDLLYFTVLILLLVLVPVFSLLLFISVRYREGNKNAVYKPEWSSNRLLETIWWGVPIAIIAVLSVVTWQTSHSLDPFRPLESKTPALNVQVVALQWKWLFIYPDHGVAAVGEMAMPINTPVAFTLTSDAPMNSFWIPQLGGQIYAMSGMSTKLHLDAEQAGDYRGVSANLSGEGHADMTFVAKARQAKEFETWIASARKGEVLNKAVYEQLRLPARQSKPTFYRVDDVTLYDHIIERYSSSHHMSGESDEEQPHGGQH